MMIGAGRRRGKTLPKENRYMKVTEKKLDDGRIQLKATATAEEVGSAFDSAQLAFAQQMNLRPQGDLSIAAVAEKDLGIKDLDSVVQPQVMEQLVPFAIDKKHIIPAFPPQATGESALKRGAEYKFSLTVTPKPEYDLSSYDPVSITVMPFSIDPAEVENEIAQMADRFAEFVADDPRPVKSGDNCLLSIEASQDGKPMTGLSTEGRTYTTGAGYMPDGFDENIIGMEVGETKTFTFEGPGIDDEGNETTETVDCTVTVLEIQKRVIPAINDAWVAKNMPMYRDATALRGAITDQITAGRKGEYENYQRQAAAAELAKRFQGRIADEVYESMQQTMLNNMRMELQQQGMTLDQFIEQNGGQQQFQMMMMMQIRETLVQGYSLDAVFRHEKMTLEEEDINEACAMLNPQNPKIAREQMERTGRGFALQEIAERMKANKWLLDHAEVTVQEPNQQGQPAQ